MFGFGNRKKALEREEQLLNAKLQHAKSKAAQTASLQALRDKVARKKAAIKKLKEYSNKDSLYRRVKAKTSPVIRGMEQKIKEKGPGIMKGLSRVGEAAARSSDMMSGSNLSGMNSPKKSSKKKDTYPRIW